MSEMSKSLPFRLVERKSRPQSRIGLVSWRTSLERWIGRFMWDGGVRCAGVSERPRMPERPVRASRLSRDPGRAGSFYIPFADYYEETKDSRWSGTSFPKSTATGGRRGYQEAAKLLRPLLQALCRLAAPLTPRRRLARSTEPIADRTPCGTTG